MLQKLRDDLKQAMKDKDTVAKLVIQGIISEADKLRIKLRHDLNDNEMGQAVRTEHGRYQEALAGAKAAKRDDLIAEAEAKLAVTEKYLPVQASKEELMTLAHAAIIAKKLDITNKGIMMKELMPILKEVTDGKTASDIVNSLIKK